MTQEDAFAALVVDGLSAPFDRLLLSGLPDWNSPFVRVEAPLPLPAGAEVHVVNRSSDERFVAAADEQGQLAFELSRTHVDDRIVFHLRSGDGTPLADPIERTVQSQEALAPAVRALVDDDDPRSVQARAAALRKRLRPLPPPAEREAIEAFARRHGNAAPALREQLDALAQLPGGTRPAPRPRKRS